MAKHVLILGFEPFGGEKINPSEMLARSLEGRLIAGRPISVRVLPVETRTLRERMEAVLFEEDPDIVIATCLFGGRVSLSLERVAVNVLDFEYADNVGIARKGDAIERGGVEARLSNLPFDRAIEAWHANGVPSYVSNASGTFIGNQALYELLALTESRAGADHRRPDPSTVSAGASDRRGFGNESFDVVRPHEKRHRNLG